MHVTKIRNISISIHHCQQPGTLFHTVLKAIGQASTNNLLKIKILCSINYCNKKRLKNVGPIHHCEPPHAHSPDVASGTVARRQRIDVHDNADDNNDNA